MDAFTTALLTYIWQHAVFTCLLFFVGRRLQRWIGAESESRRIHGQYVFWWSLAGFSLGGPILVFLLRADESGTMGADMFGFLGGWLVGTINGAAVLLMRRRSSVQD
jgi:hypothetical protein